MTKLVDCTDTLRLKYDRDKKLGYGVPVEKDIRFMGDEKLKEALIGVRTSLKDVRIDWWEYIDHFLIAGLHVDKKGAHGKGLAWDFDGVVLKPLPFDVEDSKKQILVYHPAMIPHKADKYLIRPMPDRIRTRFDCLMSLRFGVVLTQGYPGHADHGHYALDPDREVKWRGSKSQIILLQETLNAWFDAGLAVDGICGGRTLARWSDALVKVGINPEDEFHVGRPSNHWLDWLRMIAFNPPGGVA